MSKLMCEGTGNAYITLVNTVFDVGNVGKMMDISWK